MSDVLQDRQGRELHALVEVAKTVISPLPLAALLQAIMNKIIGVLEPAEIGAIMLWDEQSGTFLPAAAFGYNLTILKQIVIQEGEAITGKAFETGKSLILASPEEVKAAMADITPENRQILTDSLGTDKLPICTVALPICVGATKYGILILETLEGPQKFSEEDLPFIMTIADLIALAIERHQLQTLAEVKREAKEAERLRAELMAALSHELRLPLTAIKGYTSALLLDEISWSDEKKAEFLGLIEEECDNMQVILKDILDSSLEDVESISVEAQPLRLEKIVRSIAEEIQRRTEKHHIIIDFPSNFPIVDADPHWIRQIFRNIIDNAIKYSPDGGLIVIRGEIRPSDILIRIADQGIGISPEDMVSLFEKYTRIPSAGFRKIPGLGLGLPIARTLVEAHGGHIWAESKVGQGTTMCFTLPFNTTPQSMEYNPI